MWSRHPLLRRLTSAVLSLALVAGTVAACLPTTVEASDAHCAPVETAAHCQRTAALDCCDGTDPEAAALPGQTLSARPDETRNAAGLLAPCGVAIPAPAPLADRAALAPSHGYPQADLTTLYSVLLI
jgi:hypothetical protein